MTTGGFRDVLLARQGERESQFNSKVRPPRPLVPRHLIVPVRERIDRHGQVAIALEPGDVRRAAGDSCGRRQVGCGRLPVLVP